MTDFEIIEFLKFAFCYGTPCQYCMLDDLFGNTCGNKIQNALYRNPEIIVSKIKKRIWKDEKRSNKEWC